MTFASIFRAFSAPNSPFRQISGAFVILALLASCSSFQLNPPPVPPSPADRAQVIDDRQIVALVATRSAADALQTKAEARGFVTREVVPLERLGLRMLSFDIPQPLDGAGAITLLESLEPGATAGVNHAYRLTQIEEQAGNRFDYASRMIGWTAGACRAHGPIGMLDTGIDEYALQPSGAKVTERSFVRGGDVPEQHGTDVAMLLVDPDRLRDVTLYSAAVVGQTSAGREEAGVDAILEALDWMASNGVRVVNVSLAGPYNKILDRGIDRAAALGLTIVASVGNDGASASPRYPAAFDNVIGVTAVDASEAIYRNAVRGDHVDLAAPGVDVLVTAQDGQRFVTGTSVAAPFVTSRIAADPSLQSGGTLATIRNTLRGQAKDLGPAGFDGTYGAGLVQAPSACW